VRPDRSTERTPRTRPVSSRRKRSHGHLGKHVDPGLRGGVEEQPVEQIAARCVEGIDAGSRAYRHTRDAAVGVVERRAADRRCAGRDDPIKQPPAGQLQDTGAHERVRGHGVGSGPGPVDERDPSSSSPEQQRGGRTRDPAADDNDVVAVHDVGAAFAAGSVGTSGAARPRR